MTTQTNAATTEAAARLREAARSGVPCAPVRDLIGSDDIAAAYAVQEQLTAAKLADGARIVGRKIGLTSEAVQQQLGVDQPDFGVLFDDMAHEDGAVLAADAVLQARAEAEVAFVLKEDLVDGELDDARIRSAIDYAVAALEICGSRVADWNIAFADTVADNASSGVYVLGTNRLTLEEFEPREVAMKMYVDDELVSDGVGSACLGDPIAAVVWLANKARDFGQPLLAGQLVLSGALGPFRPYPAGATVRAVIEPLGTVSFSVSEEQA